MVGDLVGVLDGTGLTGVFVGVLVGILEGAEGEREGTRVGADVVSFLTTVTTAQLMLVS